LSNDNKLSVGETVVKKLSLATFLVVLASSALAQYDVLDPKGKKIGTATDTNSVSSGKIVSKGMMTIAQNGMSIVLTTLSTHTGAGDPIGYTLGMKATNQGSTMSVETKVTFNGRKATLVTTAMGRKETKTVTAPGTVRDVTRVWATGKVPAVGAKTTYYQLDPVTVTFVKHTDTYHGIRSIKIGGKNVSAHVIVAVSSDGTSKEYFTSKGELLRLESPQFTLVKR
jgi:hypothetical protein